MILDAHDRIGDNWRERYDSMRLFTPSHCDRAALRGTRAGARTPTKDELADYFEDYVARFRLPVRTGVWVRGLRREGDAYLVDAGDVAFECGECDRGDWRASRAEGASVVTASGPSDLAAPFE